MPTGTVKWLKTPPKDTGFIAPGKRRDGYFVHYFGSGTVRSDRLAGRSEKCRSNVRGARRRQMATNWKLLLKKPMPERAPDFLVVISAFKRRLRLSGHPFRRHAGIAGAAGDSGRPCAFFGAGMRHHL